MGSPEKSKIEMAMKKPKKQSCGNWIFYEVKIFYLT